MMEKTIEYYLNLPYQILITPDEEGYGIAVPDLPGCFSHAETWETILPMIREAMELWIGLALRKNRTIPEPAPILATQP